MRWRRRRGSGRGNRTVTCRYCHDPCRDSPIGWTCGSSSSSTWRFSCLSTCCPERAAQGHGHQGNSHLPNTGGGRGGAFVRDKQLGTGLHSSLRGGGTFLYCTLKDLCVSQVGLSRFYLYPCSGVLSRALKVTYDWLTVLL